MGVPRDILNDHADLRDFSILSCYRGSITHGTYRPSKEPTSIDDKDALFVVVPDLYHYFGLKQYGSRGTREIKRGEWDIVAYEAKKMISLLTKGNPNVLSALWLEPNHYLDVRPAGQMLIDNRDAFVGKHVYRSFTGYAYSQLKRMTHYTFEGYMGSKRKALVDEFGYDTKNAAHLIRLLRMGIEFLTDGRLYVQRQDAPQLLEIKRGEWSLDQVKRLSDNLFERAEEAFVHSTLPVGPDRERILDLCIRVVREELLRRGEL